LKPRGRFDVKSKPRTPKFFEEEPAPEPNFGPIYSGYDLFDWRAYGL
jgi:hypothetical protein